MAMNKSTRGFSEEVKESLWRQADACGLTRRRFLAILGMGGAAAVLDSCTAPTTSTTTSSVPGGTLTASVTSTPALNLPAFTAPARELHDPKPEQFFIPIGSMNAEMRFEQMASRTYTTPNSLFFARNHDATPVIDPKNWMLSVQGDGVSTPLRINYNELLKMPAVTITRYVECAGNGRSFYDTLLHNPAQGGQWKLGAYGVAEWTGVRLSEILNQANIKSSAVDVMPSGLDSLSIERPMPVAKAMMDDTIVAYMMHGDILPADHGFPARVIAPDWVGVASIKWLGKITVSQTPIYVEKNTTSYILEGLDYPPQPPAIGQVLSDNTMKSACCLPWPATLNAGSQKVTGYAWSPFGKIAKVEVSTNGGIGYQQAALTGPNIERAGTRWEFTFNAVPGDMTLTPRASDDKGNTQPPASTWKWNRQGYVFGAAVPHPVKVV
jgi:sulfane dehydrogenase subunit SoxC